MKYEVIHYCDYFNKNKETYVGIFNELEDAIKAKSKYIEKITTKLKKEDLAESVFIRFCDNLLKLVKIEEIGEIKEIKGKNMTVMSILRHSLLGKEIEYYCGFYGNTISHKYEAEEIKKSTVVDVNWDFGDGDYSEIDFSILMSNGDIVDLKLE